MLTELLNIILALPFCFTIIVMLLPQRNEKLISAFVFPAMGIHLLLVTSIILLWVADGANVQNIQGLTLFSSHHYNFYLDFYFDEATAVFLWIGSLMVFLIVSYSRIYMHNEEGYKRFFYTLMFAFCGYCICVAAGNFETMFIGWEFLGLTSFLMVVFYRTRYLPVKNAFKVFSIYRIGDVGFLLAMWASHHLWHENITFMKLHNAQLVHHQIETHSLFGFFIATSLLLAACAKSAQLPFSSWLPRAMEGPTPSSAIFYGALSVHLGVLLLYRTFPFWEHQIIARILIGLVGVATVMVGAIIVRVQSSIKSQIAYASTIQIGLMFVELSLGWKHMALVHFVGNAFLRTYQLLLSPSAVSYLIREQFYFFEPGSTVSNKFSRISVTLYLLGLKEWNLDFYLNRYIWKPMKFIGRTLHYMSPANVFRFTIPVFFLGCVLYFFHEQLPPVITAFMPELYTLTGLVLVFRAYVARRSVMVPWVLLLLNHFWVAMGVSINSHLSFQEVLYYISGVLVSGIAGFILLYWLRKREPTIDLDRFQGHVYEYPRAAFVFLVAAMGLAGFPITLSFIGEDILFSHIGYDQIILAGAAACGFVVSGISLIRMYARIFLGPHIKQYHAVSYRSS